MPYPYSNPYYPNAYQPYQMPQYQPYQPQVTQPVMAQQAAPAQQTQPFMSQSGIIWVATLAEAQNYPVAPNNAVTLWSTSEPVVYVKQADATGKPTMRIYDLVERQETAQNGAIEQGGKSIDYATKEDLQAVVSAVTSMDSAIGTIKGDIDTIKGDMYGIAGKKKTSTAKKQEEGDE